ncbi:hypothetical protein GCM10010420_47890 [Streptomyces glaucosporus]|uniref:Response regulatory domain-containing protein n=1 Tax=Streptomyces glaucosporus TaxID=284044 RepID=A0ABN3IUS7_9ACTN
MTDTGELLVRRLREAGYEVAGVAADGGVVALAGLAELRDGGRVRF